jgi:hypothetical protein
MATLGWKSIDKGKSDQDAVLVRFFLGFSDTTYLSFKVVYDIVFS